MKNMNAKTVPLSAFVLILGAAAACAAELGPGGAMTALPTAQKRAELQGEIGDSVASPVLGLTVPVSELNLSKYGLDHESPGDPGLAVGARYLYQATHRLSVGGEVTHQNLGDRAFVSNGFDGTIGGSVLTFQGLARYWLTAAQTVNPYLIGGLGINDFANHLRETSDPANVVYDSDSVGLALSGGGGVEGRFGSQKNLVAGAEVLWGLSTIDSGKFGSSMVNALGMTGRLGYKF